MINKTTPSSLDDLASIVRKSDESPRHRDLGPIKMILSMSIGGSLSSWMKLSIINRETALYYHLADYQIDTCIIGFSPGNESYLSKPLTYYSLLSAPRSFKSPITWMLICCKLFQLPFDIGKVDLIKTNQLTGALMGIIYSIIYRKPLLLRVGYEPLQNTFSSGKNIFTLRSLFNYLLGFMGYRWATLVIASSDSIKAFIVKTYGVSPSRVRVIQNSIDLNLFHPKPKLTISKSKTLLYVGRLSEEKRVDLLLESMKYLPSNVNCIIIGEGPMFEQLINFSNENNLRCTFLGKVDNSQICRIMQEADIFCFFSLYEGNPKALLEAMACGLPIVATDSPGITDVLTDKINCVQALPNPHSVAQAIMLLLSDEKLTRSISKEARLYTELHNNVTANTKEESMIIKSITKSTMIEGMK